MKTYILPGLTEAQLSAVRKANIQLFNWKKGSYLIDNDETLQQVLAVLGATATETPSHLEGMFLLQLYFPVVVKPGMDPKRAQSRTNYIKACAARFESLVKVVRETLRKKSAELPKAEAQFVTVTRQSAFVNDTRSEQQVRTDFSQELQRVREVAKVTRVRMTRDGRTLLVFTDTLTAAQPDSEDRFEIGKFLIRIQINGHPDPIRFYNGSRRVRSIQSGMNAPYVFPDGTMMELEIKQTLLELLARCEFAALVDLAIQFIELVNDDDAGQFVSAWPPAKVQ